MSPTTNDTTSQHRFYHMTLENVSEYFVLGKQQKNSFTLSKHFLARNNR